MGLLPAARNTTYISGVTPVKANDLNDIQDSIVAVNNLVTGQPQADWTNVALAGNLTVGGQLFSFTDFTYTADSTTDQLAATANPLQTGDGPLHVSSTNAFPGGLGFGTDYYWIKVDADHGKVATSRANAIAGVFIDITSNGTGTQTLVHQVSTTRVSDAEVTRNLTVDGNATVSGAATFSGSAAVTGLLSPNGGIGGPLAYTGISPPALSAGNNNNYNPTGLSTAVIVRITTAGGSPFLTGIAGGASNRILYLYNVGADTITVTHQDGSSSAANQFLTPTGASLSLATNQSMTWMYDATSSKWRLFAKNF